MAVIFGLGWVFTKSALADFPPIFLACLRFGLTASTLLWFVKPAAPHVGELVFISTLAIGLPYSLSYTAMSHLDVSTAVLLAQLEAPALVVVAAFALRERPTRSQIVGIAVSVTGVAVLAGPPLRAGQFFSVALALGSTLAWSFGQIRIRKLGDFGGLRTLAWASLFATPQLFILSLVFESGQFHAVAAASAWTWMAVGYLGVVMTALGVGVWYHLLSAAPVVEVAPFLLLVPPISIAGGYLLLSETPSVPQLLGGALIVIGVAVTIMAPLLPTSARRNKAFS